MMMSIEFLMMLPTSAHLLHLKSHHYKSTLPSRSSKLQSLRRQYRKSSHWKPRLCKRSSNVKSSRPWSNRSSRSRSPQFTKSSRFQSPQLRYNKSSISGSHLPWKSSLWRWLRQQNPSLTSPSSGFPKPMNRMKSPHRRKSLLHRHLCIWSLNSNCLFSGNLKKWTKSLWRAHLKSQGSLHWNRRQSSHAKSRLLQFNMYLQYTPSLRTASLKFESHRHLFNKSLHWISFRLPRSSQLQSLHLHRQISSTSCPLQKTSLLHFRMHRCLNHRLVKKENADAPYERWKSPLLQGSRSSRAAVWTKAISFVRKYVSLEQVGSRWKNRNRIASRNSHLENHFASGKVCLAKRKLRHESFRNPFVVRLKRALWRSRIWNRNSRHLSLLSTVCWLHGNPERKSPFSKELLFEKKSPLGWMGPRHRYFLKSPESSFFFGRECANAQPSWIQWDYIIIRHWYFYYQMYCSL